MCTPDSHICVGCIDSFQTCGPNQTCNAATHQCVPADPNAPCTKTADCPRPGIDPTDAVACELDAGICVGCVSNANCVSPDVCVKSIAKCGDPCMLCTATQVCDRSNQICRDIPDAGTSD